MTNIKPLAYDTYAITGRKLYEQVEGEWQRASGRVVVMYYYADTVGQGFPTRLQQNVDEYVKKQEEE